MKHRRVVDTATPASRGSPQNRPYVVTSKLAIGGRPRTHDVIPCRRRLIYLDANLALTEQALAKAGTGAAPSVTRYRPDDQLMAFLKGL